MEEVRWKIAGFFLTLLFYFPKNLVKPKLGRRFWLHQLDFRFLYKWVYASIESIIYPVPNFYCQIGQSGEIFITFIITIVFLVALIITYKHWGFDS